jgi:hypothetical protein
MELELTRKPKTESLDNSVEYTKRIIVALKKKVREHNAEASRKVTFNQLKTVFVEGVKERDGTKKLPLCGFARVNMFLRLYNSESIAHEFKVRSATKNPKSLLLDFSNYISPAEQDYVTASKDCEKHQLDFDFNNSDELYFSDYEHLPVYGEYL